MSLWGIGLILVVMLSSCQPLPPPGPTVVWKSAPDTIPIPPHVERLAVLYPTPNSSREEEAYSRLGAAVFQTKAARPALRVVDRVDLDLLLEAQQHELGAKVTEEQAVRAGRLMGLDSLMLFRLQSAGEPGHARVTITAKLLALESGEILFHHVVMARAPWPLHEAMTAVNANQAMQAALDVAVEELIVDLQDAFGAAGNPALIGIARQPVRDEP